MKSIWYFAKDVHSFAGKMLYLNLVGSILSSLFEGIGIFLLIPLISLTGVFNIPYGNVSKLSWLHNLFKGIPEGLTLILILVCYVLLITGQSLFQRNQTILNTRIQHGYLRYLREETYKALVRSNWSFFLKKRKSDIINLIITDIGRVSGGILMLLQFIASLVFTLIQIGIAFWLSAKLTIVVMLFGSAIIFLSRKLIKKSSKIGLETVELGKVFLAGITDHFNGIKDIKSNTLEDSHIGWVRTVGLKLERNVVEMVKLSTVSQLIFKVVSAFLMAFFLFFSIKMFRAQPAQLMLIMAIFSRLWPRFSGIQSNLEQIGGVIPSFKDLIELQNECKNAREIDEKTYQDLKVIEINKGIKCREVFFRYNLEQPKFTLSNINIEIPFKQMTAIVGHSGAGKSTLIDLLMGLNKPERGSIFIDGTPLTGGNLFAFRKSVSYVPQDPFLFNTTVRENLLIMKPDATDDELWEALEFAAAAQFVNKLPQKLETLIGDRGIKLSGGERQRLVLARAILKNPSILILDEATSALDTENETTIQQALESIRGRMTLIVIAHRLSTIRNAEQVIVLKDGQVVQQGGYTQLSNDRRGVFGQLLLKQMSTIS